MTCSVWVLVCSQSYVSKIEIKPCVFQSLFELMACQCFKKNEMVKHNFESHKNFYRKKRRRDDFESVCVCVHSGWQACSHLTAEHTVGGVEIGLRVRGSVSNGPHSCELYTHKLIYSHICKNK